MLGPAGMLAHADSADIASRADNLIIFEIMAWLTY
jgi:hypothetical protein